MSIKAILLDIDGTLTNNEKKITDETKKALINAEKLGIRLVIASGRPVKGLDRFGDQLEMSKNHGIYVAFNGGKVVDCETKEVIFDQAIDTETAKAVLKHLEQFDVRPMITYGDYMVVRNVYDCMINDNGRVFNVIDYEAHSNGYQLMESFDFAEFWNEPTNKILTAGDSEYLKEHWQEMAAPFEGKLSMMFTANFYYEYTAMGIDKGKALTVAMERLGIKPEECIAFGDAENDIAMLKYAGIGVAMANAQQALLDVADEVTLDNNHDGIAASLYKHIPELKEMH